MPSKVGRFLSVKVAWQPFQRYSLKTRIALRAPIVTSTVLVEVGGLCTARALAKFVIGRCKMPDDICVYWVPRSGLEGATCESERRDLAVIL